MRQPLRVKNPRAAVTNSKTLPAPIGGWNAQSSLAAMPETDAVELVNWFPGTSTVDLRGGSIGPRAVGAAPRTLMSYAGLDGSSALFAVGGGVLWVVTDYTGLSMSGSYLFNGAATATLQSNHLIWTMFGDGTSQYLIGCNGANAPFFYTGSTYLGSPRFDLYSATTSPSLSGVGLETINYVNVYKGRLFFLVNDSLQFYYLSAGDAGGSLSSFDLSSEAKRGGHLVAMSSWTRDAGDGQDDVAVFITSEGEAIIYQGNNPGSANSWAKIGTFYVGRPLGNRCMRQYGPDLLILTESGLFELSKLLETATISNKFALSYKIEKAFTEAARLYGRNTGWSLTHYPAKNALIVNVPIRPGAEHEQYIMNTVTKSWCRFTGWNAEDFAVHQGQLYFVEEYLTAGFVLQAWSGGHDYATYEYAVANSSVALKPIVHRARQAYTPLGRSGRQKRVTMVRPLLDVGGHRTYQVGIDVDYQQLDPDGTVEYRSTQAVWGEALWGVSVFPTEPEISREWSSVPQQPGMALSVSLRGSFTDWPHETAASATTEIATDPGLKWIATDLVFEEGGPL